MDAEILEKLILDQALGQLPPETMALLEAYLAHDADARTQMAAYEKVTTMATRAIAENAPATMPSRTFPAAALKRRHVVRRASRWGAAAAACIAAGFLVGRWNGAEVRHEVPNLPEISAQGGKEAATPARGNIGVPDFWSQQRLRALAAQPRQVQSTLQINGIPVFNGFRPIGE